MNVKTLLALTALLLSACAANIRGTVQLVDSRQQPIPNESPKGVVVNMINTKAAVDQASASASVDEKGEFESPKDSIKPGVYKVEVSRIGYETQTETVEVGSFGKKLEFKLRRIDEAKRKSIKGATSDEDKIINLGEVNLQAPAMRAGHNQNRGNRHECNQSASSFRAARCRLARRLQRAPRPRGQGAHRRSAGGTGEGRRGPRGAWRHRRPGRVREADPQESGRRDRRDG